MVKLILYITFAVGILAGLFWPQIMCDSNPRCLASEFYVLPGYALSALFLVMLLGFVWWDATCQVTVVAHVRKELKGELSVLKNLEK